MPLEVLQMSPNKNTIGFRFELWLKMNWVHDFILEQLMIWIVFLWLHARMFCMQISGLVFFGVTFVNF